MGYFSITATVKAQGNIDVVNPLVLWRPVPSYKSNDVQYQFYFYSSTDNMNNDEEFIPKEFSRVVFDSSLDLTNTANWASMRAKAESLLEAIPEIGDNVTYNE